MKDRNRQNTKYRLLLQSVYHYSIFFLLTGFITTCSTMLFVTVLTKSLNLTLTHQTVGTAAKLTFVNVMLLSALFASIDALRRKFIIRRPVKKITHAAEEIMRGNFSVRIAPLRGISCEESFNRIIDCFNQMAEELAATETLQTDFIANVSHELKTPLAVMQNYAALLAKPGLSEEKRIEYSHIIADSSQRLATLITNILRLNKLENQQLSPAKEVYNLSEQLCECLLTFEDTWEAKQLTVQTQLADDIFVCSDAEMMTLVWNNLFSNAIKFTEPGGTISLQLWTEENDAVVQVSDTGCGISGDVGTHIFDKFYQGDPSHATQGNGLGLALVKRVIDLTGSDIAVESHVGHGSVFTVRMRRSVS